LHVVRAIPTNLKRREVKIVPWACIKWLKTKKKLLDIPKAFIIKPVAEKGGMSNQALKDLVILSTLP